ncbi:6-phosphogluconate dehydrogenase C-terminal domain-like protein [Ramaria rubella]|nr:6-phosphogluconate dehydrogenase C-terminal domain-like protein [Ramaria rubella]
MSALGPTIGLLSAGAMGSAVAHRLTAHGCTVLTSLAGRSAASKERAQTAGMQDAGLEEIAKRARYVLSILPPSSALSFAKQFTDVLRKQPPTFEKADSGVGDRPAGMQLIFADCNAVSPASVHQIVTHFSEDAFVDACIIGGPPSIPSESPVYDPTFYASGSPHAVEAFARALTVGGLKVSTLQAGVGDASALKMGYAGINKGLTGLTAAMILATHASSPATSAALMRELSLSQPVLLQRTTRMVPDMLPKAYRFVGEMEEISEFVNTGVQGGTADIWQGLARLFERVAESVREGGDDVKVLQGFVDDAKTAVNNAKK